MWLTVNPSSCTSWRICSYAPPGSTTIACFVTGSPMIEQLQPSGGTENVFRIMPGMIHACYSPTPSRRKQQSNDQNDQSSPCRPNIGSGTTPGQFMECVVDKWRRTVDNPKKPEGRDVRNINPSSQWASPALFMSTSA